MLHNKIIHLVFLIGLQSFAIHCQIDINLCGKDYLCLRKPVDCTSTTNCDALAAFKYDKDSGEVIFELSSPNKWVGLGQKGVTTTGDRMVKLRGQYCLDTGAGVVLGNFNGNSLSSANTPTFVKTVPEVATIENKKNPDNTIYCKFKRPIKTAKSNENDLYALVNKELYVMAYGESIKGTGSSALPDYHGSGKYISSVVNVINATSLIAETSLPSKVKLHGIFMSIAWTLLATCGIYMPRFMKPVLSEQKIFGKAAWFVVHQSTMGSCVLSFIIGLIAILVHFKGKWVEHASEHHWLGLFTIMTGLIQPVMAMFRPDPTHKRRYIFNWAHRLTGVLAWSLGGSAVVYGLKLAHLKETVAIVFVIVVVVLFVVLDFILVCRKGDGFPTAMSFSSDHEELRSGDKEDGGKKGSLLHWLFLILIFGFAIAVTVYHVNLILS